MGEFSSNGNVFPRSSPSLVDELVTDMYDREHDRDRAAREADRIAAIRASQNNAPPAKLINIPGAPSAVSDWASSTPEPRALSKIEGSHGPVGINSMMPSEQLRKTSPEYLKSLHPDVIGNATLVANNASVAAGQPQQTQLTMPHPQFVAGGWNKNLLPFKPETMAMQDAAIERHLAANEQGAQASSAQAKALDAFHSGNAIAAETRLNEDRAKLQERDIQYKQAVQKYDDFVNDAGSEKIDPNRYWRNNGAASNFALAIGSALGGWVNAKTGAQNAVLDRINRSISADIAGQEHDIATKKWKAGAQMNMLGELRAQGMDALTARNALESAQLKIADEHLKAIMPRTEDPIMQARYAEAAAGIEDKRVELKKQADMLQYRPPHMVGGTGGVNKTDLGKVFMGADGRRYIARNEESRKKAAESATVYSNVLSSLNDYKKALQGVDATDRAAFKMGITTDAMSKAQTAYNHALSPMRQAQNDGVWKKGEVEMLAQTLTPPDHWTGDAIGQADLAQEQARRVNDNVMRTEDAVPVETGFNTNAMGQLTPGAEYTGQQQQPMHLEMPGKKIGP